MGIAKEQDGQDRKRQDRQDKTFLEIHRVGFFQHSPKKWNIEHYKFFLSFLCSSASLRLIFWFYST